jgi:hypothetical protein
MNWWLLSAAVIGIGAVAVRRYAPWLGVMLRAKLESSPQPPVLREATALDHMIETLRREKDPLERHRLLGAIVDESHRQRTDAAMKKMFVRFAGMHVKELPHMAAALKAAHGGKLPAVPAFELLAAAMEEEGRQEEAASVRKQAEQLGLIDRLPGNAVGRTRTPAKKIERVRPPVKRTTRARASVQGKRKA